MLVIEKKGRLTVRKRRVQGNDEFGVHIFDLQKYNFFSETAKFYGIFSVTITIISIFHAVLGVSSLGHLSVVSRSSVGGKDRV